MKTIKIFRRVFVSTAFSFLVLISSTLFAQESSGISSAKFLQEAATSGMNTVALGNLGQKRLENPELKNYAQNILNTHMVSNAKIKALAKKKKISLPDPMSIPINSMQTRADTTKKDDAATQADSLTTNFDAEYIQMMIDDHKKAIALFEKGKTSADKDIRAFAEKSLPVLKQHLNDAEKLAAAAATKE